MFSARRVLQREIVRISLPDIIESSHILHTYGGIVRAKRSRKCCAIYTRRISVRYRAGWFSRVGCPPRVRRNPKGGFIQNSRRNTAYSGGPIADYYRVPCGFKLSRYVRVPRELSSSPHPRLGGVTRPLTLGARVYISGISRHRRISPIRRAVPHVLRPSIDYAPPTPAEITPLCLYKALGIYWCMA